MANCMLYSMWHLASFILAWYWLSVIFFKFHNHVKTENIVHGGDSMIIKGW